MKGKSPDPSQLNLLPQRLEDLLDPKHPLCKLAKQEPVLYLLSEESLSGVTRI